MSTLDRLRGIVHGTRPSAIPVLAPELTSHQSVRGGGPLDPPEYTRAALVLGGAVVERSEGAVIVVDREYRSNALHGRLPIGDVASVITEGTDALNVMAAAWPAFAPRATADKPSPTTGRDLMFLDLETTGLFGGAGTQAFLVGCAAIEGDSIRIRQFLLPGGHLARRECQVHREAPRIHFGEAFGALTLTRERTDLRLYFAD